MSVSRHALYNLTGSLVPLAVTFFTVPAYITLIGEARYGILAIVWVLLGYFGLFDLGLSRATAHRIAAMRDAPLQEQREVFWTALGLNLLFGLLGAALLWPTAGFFFEHLFKMNTALRPEALAAVPWLAGTVPVVTVSGVLAGVLQGRERFLALNAISVTGTALGQIVPLAVAWHFGPNLAWLIPAAVLVRVGTLVLLTARCRRLLGLSLRPTFRRQLVKPLFHFGGWVTVTAIVGPLLSTFDRLIIGMISGAQAVTQYTVPFNLANRVTVLPGSLASAVFPRFASANVVQQRCLAEQSIGALIAVLGPVLIIGLLAMRPFLAWWIDPDFAAKAAPVGEIILLGLWANGLAYVPYALLQGRGRPDLVAKTHVAELLPYLLLLTLGLHLWGLVGAALAWSLRVGVDMLVLFHLGQAWPDKASLMLAPLVPLCLASATAWFCSPSDMAFWILGPAALGAALWFSWRYAPKSLRRKVLYAIPPVSHLSP
jgi:O-antigen/teichoic acid export membrane protein